ncbi:hypothetical protein ACA910_004375 [Epithemia clementina (nom. ined.)]
MTGYNSYYNDDQNVNYASPYQPCRRHTVTSYSPNPPKMSHDGEIVVFSESNLPESPLSYKSTYPSAEVSAAMTEVSMPSYNGYSTTDDSHPYDPKPGYEGALVVRSEDTMVKNPSSLPPEILKMKKNRRRYTVGAGVVGGVIGLVALGPVGAVFGGVGGAVATKQIGKRREKRKLQKLSDREIARQHANAPDVEVHSGEFL